ncbi:uncharacterized protein LOC128207119 [Mya arenaria]|nr:uncharacterized protein LOC128207119 [Mya arenaria]
MEPGSIFPDGVPPTQQPSGSRRRHSSNMNVYADINEETMENYHYICEQNSPDQYDEINVTNYDRDIEIVPSKEFTDESISGRSVAKSEGKNVFDSAEETVRGVTEFNGDIDQVCKSDSTSGVNPKRSDMKSNSNNELVGTNDILDLEAHCQTTKAENRQMQAAKYCNEGEDINEETMDYYHYVCEKNSPDHYDEINVTNYDRDTEIVPSKEFTYESISGRSVAKSEGKNVFDITEETVRGVTEFNGDLDQVCKSDSTSGVNPKRSDMNSNSSNELVGTNDVLDLEAHCQTTKAENRQMQAAKHCNDDENIFGDLGQFQVDYIHAIASECELLDNKLDHQTVQSSL